MKSSSYWKEAILLGHAKLQLFPAHFGSPISIAIAIEISTATKNKPSVPESPLLMPELTVSNPVTLLTELH